MLRTLELLLHLIVFPILQMRRLGLRKMRGLTKDVQLV